MEDIFKQFRDNLEGRPEPPYEEGDWKRMAAQLDSQQEKTEGKKRTAPFAWWWVALPMLLLLMGFNLLIFKELHIAKQKLAAFEIRNDTVFVERVFFRTDTVYQTRTLRERVVEYLPARFATENAADAYFDDKNTPATNGGRVLPIAIGTASVGLANLDGVGSPDSYRENPDSVGHAAYSSLGDIEKIRLLTLLPIKRQKVDLPKTTVAQVDLEKRKTLRQILYPVTPKDFSLLANGGLVRPVDDGIVNGKGYALGLEGRVGFSPRLALWLDASYSETAAEVDRMDEALGVPTMPPPADEFSFLSADVQYRTWQYAAGMQYAFFDNKNWKGWFGAGYGAVAVRPYQVTYDFVNIVNNLEWPDFKGETLRLGHLGDYLLLRLGVERKLSSHLYGQLMATWRTRLGGTGLQPVDLLGLRVGVVYGF